MILIIPVESFLLKLHDEDGNLIPFHFILFLNVVRKLKVRNALKKNSLYPLHYHFLRWKVRGRCFFFLRFKSQNNTEMLYANTIPCVGLAVEVMYICDTLCNNHCDGLCLYIVRGVL